MVSIAPMPDLGQSIFDPSFAAGVAFSESCDPYGPSWGDFESYHGRSAGPREFAPEPLAQAPSRASPAHRRRASSCVRRACTVDDALSAGRVTAADVEAYWASRASSGGAAAGLVSSSTSRKSSSSSVNPYSEWERYKEVEAIFRRHEKRLEKSIPPEFPRGGVVPVEVGPDCLAVDPALMRFKRTRESTVGAANMVQRRLGSSGFRYRPVFVTLTYRDVDQFAAKQISDCLAHMRKWAERKDFVLSYVWVCECGEQTGRVHYHVVLWLPKRFTLPMPDKQGWWPWGMSQVQRGRSPAGYLAKYAGKGVLPGTPQIPKGARVCGRGGLSAVERAKLAWGRAPEWVREHWPEWESHPRPAVGGGYVSRVSGEYLASPWEFLGMRGACAVVRRREVAA